jgi:hypothetical protein
MTTIFFFLIIIILLGYYTLKYKHLYKENNTLFPNSINQVLHLIDFIKNLIINLEDFWNLNLQEFNTI